MGLQDALSYLTKNPVTKGQDVREVASAERMAAIVEALAELSIGRNIARGHGIRKGEGVGTVTLSATSTAPGGRYNHPWRISWVTNASAERTGISIAAGRLLVPQSDTELHRPWDFGADYFPNNSLTITQSGEWAYLILTWELVEIAATEEPETPRQARWQVTDVTLASDSAVPDDSIDMQNNSALSHVELAQLITINGLVEIQPRLVSDVFVTVPAWDDEDGGKEKTVTTTKEDGKLTPQPLADQVILTLGSGGDGDGETHKMLTDAAEPEDDDDGTVTKKTYTRQRDSDGGASWVTPPPTITTGDGPPFHVTGEGEPNGDLFHVPPGSFYHDTDGDQWYRRIPKTYTEDGTLLPERWQQETPSWAGQVGPTGPSGSGPTGQVGPVGPTGPTGDPAFTWKSGWLSSAGYDEGDAVRHNDSVWRANTDTAAGEEPGVSDDWDLWTSDGAAGAVGPTGDIGPLGAPGNIGPQGDGWTDVSINPAGQVVFSSNDGLGYISPSIIGPEGPQGLEGDIGPIGPTGDGFSGGAYDPQTGQVTFTSPQGLGFTTGDLRGDIGPVGDTGPGYTGGSYNANTGIVTFSGPANLGFSTGDLRGDIGPEGPSGDTGKGWTDVSINPSGQLVFSSDDELGYISPDIRGGIGPEGPPGPSGPVGADSTVAGPIGAPGQIGPIGAPGPIGPTGDSGADSTVAGPIGAPGPAGADSTVAGPVGPIGDTGKGWTNVSINPSGQVVFSSNDGLGYISPSIIGPEGPQGLEGDIGPIGPTGDGFSGGAYDPQTGQVTFTSPQGLGFTTGDLRGDQGPVGDTGPGYTGGSYNPYTGIVTFSGPANLGFSTGDLRGPTGPEGPSGDTGKGWTDVSINPSGQLVFSSDDDLGYISPDIRGSVGPQGPSGPGYTNVVYNANDGRITFTKTDGTTYTTGDVRGGVGPTGPQGAPGPTGPSSG